MAVDLIYKHQQKTYELMREELKRSKRAAYTFPTGCGKSFPTLKYIEENPDKTVLIIVPSTVIKGQWKKYIEYYVDNGKERLKNKNIAIVTYQKLLLLFKKAKNLKANITIVDEEHRWLGKDWEKALDANRENQTDAEWIGLTATKDRTDGRDALQEKFEGHIVYEMSLTEALSGEKEGEVILRSPRYVRVLSQLMPQIREYKERISYIEDEEKRQRLLKRYERLESIVSNSPDIQDVMLAGMQKKNGKYIVFCKDREDMIDKMAQAQQIFGKVNSKIHTEYVITRNEKGDTFGKTSGENRRTLERFESAETTEELQLLFCVDMLNEGVHIDGIDGEVLFDLTKSPVLYKQRIGRVTSPNGEAVIIDAVNNWLNQIDTYYELENAIKKGQSNGKDEESQDYDLFKLSPEETELLQILREIGEEFKYNDNKTYEDIIKWLETHDGKMPRGAIGKTKRHGLTEDERKELQLYDRWIHSKERKILEEYKEKTIEEVPQEYREKIQVLRDYGLGLTTYEQIIEWLKEHDGRMPRGTIRRDGNTPLKIGEMTQEEQYEVNLYNRWNRLCEEKNILGEYIGKSIEEVPEEYREKIRVLRDYGLGLTTYEQIIEWLKEHDGKMPRAGIKKKNSRKNLTREEMTQEEQYEVKLCTDWNKSQEKKILDQYVGKTIEEVPEEYREKINVLRNYGFGLKCKKRIQPEQNVFEQIIEWLENHDGKMPSEKEKPRTPEDYIERDLRRKWHNSKERMILNKYIGMPIDEIPEKYKEMIRALRKYGLGIEKQTTYEQIIKWLEMHDMKMPRTSIKKKNGREILTSAERTEEENYEVRLRKRWEDSSQEKKILDKYAGRPIEEVPEEYREKISKLRSLGQLGTKKDDKIKGRMKKAVGKAVGENGTTREELGEIKRS